MLYTFSYYFFAKTNHVLQLTSVHSGLLMQGFSRLGYANFDLFELQVAKFSMWLLSYLLFGLILIFVSVVFQDSNKAMDPRRCVWPTTGRSWNESNSACSRRLHQKGQSQVFHTYNHKQVLFIRTSVMILVWLTRRKVFVIVSSFNGVPKTLLSN